MSETPKAPKKDFSMEPTEPASASDAQSPKPEEVSAATRPSDKLANAAGVDPADFPESPEPPEPYDELTFGNTPNYLTLLRIAFVPLVVALLWARRPELDLAAAIIFALASITDFLDGYIARAQKIVTVYGKLLDPLADKFLVVSSIVMLQELGRIPVVVVILLVCRELAITGLRALASAEGLIIAASAGGKIKTASQMVAIPLIMVKHNLFGIPTYLIGQVLLYVSLAMSLWSAKDYVVDFFKALSERRREKLKKKREAREKRRNSGSQGTTTA